MDPACSTPAGPDDKGAVAAMLSPPGRGALAVVGVFGPAATDTVSACFRPRGTKLMADRPDGSILFGSWVGTDAAATQAAVRLPAEDLVVVKRSSNDVEIHPHGGRTAAERVLVDLEASGCRRIDWPAFLEARGLSTVEVEVRRALAMAAGPKAAAILARQLAVPGDRGVPSTGPGILERALGEVGRLAEAGRADAAATQARRLLEWASLGLRLTQPWRVVVVGPPNAGKSSLINAIAGFARSIVAPEAGTTRDLLEARIVLDGWEIILVDTAGLRDVAADAVERQGIDRARDAVRTADLVIEVSEARQTATVVEGACGDRHRHVLRVATKVDLAGAARSAEDVARRIQTSAITGEGMGTLVTAILRALAPEEPEADVPVPFTPRQLAALKSAADGADDALSEGSRRTAPPPERSPRR